MAKDFSNDIAYKELLRQMYVVVGSTDNDCSVGLCNSVFNTSMPSTLHWCRKFCNREVTPSELITVFRTLIVKDTLRTPY